MDSTSGATSSTGGMTGFLHVSAASSTYRRSDAVFSFIDVGPALANCWTKSLLGLSVGEVGRALHEGYLSGPILAEGPFASRLNPTLTYRLIRLVGITSATDPRWITLVNELPRWKHSGAPNITCAICLDDYSETGGDVSELPCRHDFHTDCIRRWLLGRLDCPVCRFNMTEKQLYYLIREDYDTCSRSLQFVF